MIRYMADPANVITIAGLALSVYGIHAALQSRFEIAVIVLLWALLADHFDGLVAKRLNNRLRGASEIGKHLDSLTDIVSGAVFPSILVLLLGRPMWIAVIAAVALCIAAALRLSYFNTYGLTQEGKFVGVPVTYNMPAIALLFVVGPYMPNNWFPGALTGLILILALLHVSPLNAPPVKGIMYFGITVFVVLMTAVLGFRVAK